MAQDSAQDRRLPATQRRLERARKEGQVPRSRDLIHLSVLGAGATALIVLGPTATQWLQDLLATGLRFDASLTTDPAAMGERVRMLSTGMMIVVLPFGLWMMAMAAAGAIASGGWVWTFQPLAPNFSKMNPITGLPKLLSKQQLVDALKGCALALLIGGIGGAYLASHIGTFHDMLAQPLPAGLVQTGAVLQSGGFLVLLAVAFSAAIDVPLQQFMHASRLKMSRQEVKDEHKELEGNGEIKAKLRALMRERANRRMIAAVPKADLVLMNPTHYAVALRYDEASMNAPRVVAKGADLLAFRIREVASEHRVPVLESPVLARALYAHADVDREIPSALFTAVAQVLAYVYQLRAALLGRAPMPAALPALNVPPELDPHHGKPAADLDLDEGATA